VAVLVLDARQGPTAHDKRIADMINRRRRGCVLLVNKWDLQPETQRTCSRALAGAMPFMTHCPVVFTSATTGYNIRQAIEAVDVVAGQMQAHLPTGVLNRVLADATRRTQAPSSGGRMLKIFYAAQVGTNPPRVRLFVNRPRQLVPEYRTYLVHALRTAFGLEGAPVVIEAVARARKNSSE
jgi:GTP-binding protein